MNGEVHAIKSEIKRVTRNIANIEKKYRMLYEEYKGNPPPEAILAYDTIMKVDAADREQLKQRLCAAVG